MRYQAAVEPRRHRVFRQFEIDIDVVVADAHQEHHLAHRIGEVFRRDHRFGHSRKARELVHHAFDILDLPHDGVGTLHEYGRILGDRRAVLAAQALGRKLDRRQRILDFMGDPPCDVGPGRAALRDHQLSDVIERDYVAVLGFGRLLGRNPHRQIALAPATVHRDLALDRPLGARARLVEQRRQLRHDRRKRTAENVRLGSRDELLGRPIDDTDAPLGIDPDHAGARPGQHRFGETAAAVDDVVRAHEVVALGPQLLCHIVEGFAELRQIPLAAADRHLHVQVSGRDLICRADQPADWRHQLVGEIEPDPYRGQQHDQRDDRVHQGEGDLHAQPAGLETGVFRHALLGRLQLLDHARIDRARDIEIRIVVAAQLEQRGDGLGFGEQRDLRLAVAYFLEGAARRRDEVAGGLEIRALDDRQVAADHQRMGQAADRRLRLEELAESLAILIEQRSRPPDVIGHRQDVAANHRGVLAQIGLGNGQRVLDHGPRACGEPAIEPPLERDAGDDRQQNGRDRGNDREQPDDAHVQLGAGAPAPPRLHDLEDLVGDDAEQHEHHRRVAQQHPHHDIVGRHHRGQAGEHQKGHDGGEQGQADGDWPHDPDCEPGRRAAGFDGLREDGLFDARHGACGPAELYANGTQRT